MATTSVANDSVKQQLGIGHVRGHRLARLTPWVIGLLLVVGVVLALRWWTSTSAPAAPAYITRDVTLGDLTVTVTATGTLTPITQVEVGSELSGIVSSVEVDDNDRVRAGQVLARIDPTRLQAQARQHRASLDAARARTQQAQATLDEARVQAARMEQLAGMQLVPASELDAARATLERANADRASAAAAVAQAEAMLQTTEADLTKTIIRSPITGIVLQRSVEAGQTVAASFQAPVLFTLAEDLTKMELDIDVDEADVGLVEAGQQATFTVDAYPDRAFTARVLKVSYSPTATSGVVTYRAALDVDNSELLLRPGMTTTADIVVRDVSQAMLVPNAALRFEPAGSTAGPAATGGTLMDRLMPRPRRPARTTAQPTNQRATGRQRVWTLRDGQPTPVEVTAGLSDGRMTAVTGDGLAVGMPVIVQASARE
jgi:HlyD family secretion protein